jgi:hypothetical protein
MVAAQTAGGILPIVQHIPPLALLTYVYRTIPKWGLRHSTLFAPYPYLALAIAWGASRTMKIRWRRQIATALLATSTLLISVPLGIASTNLLTNPHFAHEDWRGVAEYVQTHRQPGDVVIIETGSVFPNVGILCGK